MVLVTPCRSLIIKGDSIEQKGYKQLGNAADPQGTYADNHRTIEGTTGLQAGRLMAFVLVQGDIEKAIRQLKKAVGREGIFAQIKRHSFYEKPSERKVRERKSAMVRRLKAERKKKARETTEVRTNTRLRKPDPERPKIWFRNPQSQHLRDD